MNGPSGSLRSSVLPAPPPSPHRPESMTLLRVSVGGSLVGLGLVNTMEFVKTESIL